MDLFLPSVFLVLKGSLVWSSEVPHFQTFKPVYSLFWVSSLQTADCITSWSPCLHRLLLDCLSTLPIHLLTIFLQDNTNIPLLGSIPSTTLTGLWLLLQVFILSDRSILCVRLRISLGQSSIYFLVLQQRLRFQIDPKLRQNNVTYLYFGMYYPPPHLSYQSAGAICDEYPCPTWRLALESSRSLFVKKGTHQFFVMRKIMMCCLGERTERNTEGFTDVESRNIDRNEDICPIPGAVRVELCKEKHF